MTSNHTFSPLRSTLVTGATGLLGNNLVRLLVSRGVQAKALVRSREKAEQQLASLGVEIVVGEMTKVSGCAKELNGIDVIFHTAEYFRDNYKGGKHWKQLLAANVLGTAHLFSEAYKAGVRRIVHQFRGGPVGHAWQDDRRDDAPQPAGGGRLLPQQDSCGPQS